MLEHKQDSLGVMEEKGCRCKDELSEHFLLASASIFVGNIQCIRRYYWPKYAPKNLTAFGVGQGRMYAKGTRLDMSRRLINLLATSGNQPIAPEAAIQRRCNQCVKPQENAPP